MIAREHYLEVDQDCKVAIVRLLGTRLDEQSLGPLRSQLQGAMKRSHFRLLVNMNDIEYLPSRVLAMFVRLHHEAKTEGGGLFFSNVRPAVRKLFEITQFYKIFVIFETEDEALRAIGKKSEKSAEVNPPDCTQ